MVLHSKSSSPSPPISPYIGFHEFYRTAFEQYFTFMFICVASMFPIVHYPSSSAIHDSGKSRLISRKTSNELKEWKCIVFIIELKFHLVFFSFFYTQVTRIMYFLNYISAF